MLGEWLNYFITGVLQQATFGEVVDLNEMSAGTEKSERIRFTTLGEFAQYLENIGDGELVFRAIPISGRPEVFHYDGHKKVVTRSEDQKLFDNVEDFLCYAFQCDREGYTHTEYVDIEI